MQACRFHFGVPVRARGFTTVEILVVVAIFTVSMLLIIPVILHARESARRTACRRNLHNLAIAYEHSSRHSAHSPSGSSFDSSIVNEINSGTGQARMSGAHQLVFGFARPAVPQSSLRF